MKLLFKLVCLLSLTLSGQLYANPESEGYSSAYENELLKIITTLQSGQLASALQQTEAHLKTYPKSRAAYLIKADLLTAMSSPLATVGPSNFDQTKELQGVIHQLKNRLAHTRQREILSNDMLPASLIEMGDHQHVLVSDMSSGRLYLYESTAEGPMLLRDYYLTVGSAGYGKQVEGDNKTPIGVYSMYRYIASNELPDLYGAGAFPVDYPNLIDRYHKRTGYGIWLHGTPSTTYARSPWASEGCFVLSNDDFDDISPFIDVEIKTPVILSEEITWISRDALNAKREMYLSLLNTWKSDWESLDSEAYLAHYSRDNFNLGKADFTKWAQAKRRTNQSKTFIQIDLEVNSLFVYPGEQDMFVVNYTQRYLSNNYHSEAEKKQYWQKDASGQWRIIYEG